MAMTDIRVINQDTGEATTLSADDIVAVEIIYQEDGFLECVMVEDTKKIHFLYQDPH